MVFAWRGGLGDWKHLDKGALLHPLGLYPGSPKSTINSDWACYSQAQVFGSLGFSGSVGDCLG
jgi:hypothetical protein